MRKSGTKLPSMIIAALIMVSVLCCSVPLLFSEKVYADEDMVTVTFDANGATFLSGEKILQYEGKYVSNKHFPGSVIDSEGQTWAIRAWSTDSEGNQCMTYPDERSEDYLNNKTLYAQWGVSDSDTWVIHLVEDNVIGVTGKTVKWFDVKKGSPLSEMQIYFASCITGYYDEGYYDGEGNYHSAVFHRGVAVSGESVIFIGWSPDISGSVIVDENYIPTADIALYPIYRSATLNIGDNVKLTAEEDSNRHGGYELQATNVTWSSSDSNIATVDSDGNITAIAAGQVTVTASWQNILGENETTSCIIKVRGNNDINDAEIDFANGVTNTSGKYWTSYDGTEKKPGVTVKYDNKTLVSGTDYTVSYVSNKNVGTAKVTIEGTGDYTGTVTKDFLICFKDVPMTHNFQSAVYWAVDEGIAAGYSGTKTGTFGVADNITRGQVVMFLWRAAGKPSPKKTTQTFSDVPVSNNFFTAIQWAYEQGIAGGYSGSRKGQFGPSDYCTRGQIAMFLWRYAGKPAPQSDKQAFSDVPKTNNFFTAIQWAAEQKITAGYKDGTFGVNKTCTRGQCVTFLYRMLGE